MPEQSRGAVLVWLVAAVLATVAVLRLLDAGEGSPSAAPVRIDGAPRAGPGAGDGAGAGAGDRAGVGRSLYIHVAGAVRRPGLLRVAPGARVAVALERAGGPTPKADLTAVNLAARLQDGQQVVVPAAGSAPTAASTGAAGAPGFKPSLGSASVEQLEELDGIGPTLAKRIVEYRQAHGGYGSLAELQRVDGIGEKRLASLSKALQP